jgi:hypothetical protein
MAVVCLSSLHRVTCVLGPSSPCGAPLFLAEAARLHEYMRKSASARISFRKHQITGDVLTFLLHILEGNHEIRQ